MNKEKAVVIDIDTVLLSKSKKYKHAIRFIPNTSFQLRVIQQKNITIIYKSANVNNRLYTIHQKMAHANIPTNDHIYIRDTKTNVKQFHDQLFAKLEKDYNIQLAIDNNQNGTKTIYKKYNIKLVKTSKKGLPKIHKLLDEKSYS